jgi:hypothetical protein
MDSNHNNGGSIKEQRQSRMDLEPTGHSTFKVPVDQRIFKPGTLTVDGGNSLNFKEPTL